MPSAFAAGLLEERAQPGDRPVSRALRPSFLAISTSWMNGGGAKLMQMNFAAECASTSIVDTTGPGSTTPGPPAREHADGIYGLDCMPREDLRQIGARDRHAVHKIAEVRQRHPEAVILSCSVNPIWRPTTCHALYINICLTSGC